MTRSMTGYASAEGQAVGLRWSWDIRSVNGRGLDIRLRLPDQIDGLDAAVRAAVQKVVSRGNVTVSLRIASDDVAGVGRLNSEALGAAMAWISEVEAVADTAGLSLAATSAAEILGLRGVVETGAAETDTAGLQATLTAEIPALLEAFDASRAAEGAALESVIGAQVDAISEQVAAARALREARSAQFAASFQAAAARVIEAADGIDDDRVAQELAVLAIKTDVTEELDRLGSHIDAARALLAQDGPKGRKLDFLTQEFNREANTLCSKAQFAPLTQIGLELKYTIDQMREQVQNVE